MPVNMLMTAVCYLYSAGADLGFYRGGGGGSDFQKKKIEILGLF